VLPTVGTPGIATAWVLTGICDAAKCAANSASSSGREKRATSSILPVYVPRKAPRAVPPRTTPPSPEPGAAASLASLTDAPPLTSTRTRPAFHLTATMDHTLEASVTLVPTRFPSVTT
jgi:hypothetical protein